MSDPTHKMSSSTVATPENRQEKLDVIRLRKVVSETMMEIMDYDVMTWIEMEKLLQPLDTSTFADVTEERQLADLCGFPMCAIRLDSKRTRQQYKIRNNKIYDLTERNRFCSDVCYQKFVHVQNQLPTEPLWIRGESSQQFVLARLDTAESQSATPGREIVFSEQQIRSAVRELRLKDDNQTPSSPSQTIAKTSAPTAITSAPTATISAPPKQKPKQPDLDKVRAKVKASASTQTRRQMPVIEAKPLSQSELSRATVEQPVLDQDSTRCWERVAGVLREVLTKRVKLAVLGQLDDLGSCGDAQELMSFYTASDQTVLYPKPTETSEKGETEQIMRVPTVDSTEQDRHRRQLVHERLQKMLDISYALSGILELEIV